MHYLKNAIAGVIEADELTIGLGVTVEHGAVIKGRRVALGDFCFIGNHVKVLAPEFEIGDYSKLHAFSFCHGELPLRIGRNCWIGGGVTLDSNGGLTLADGVGVGAGSQLWTHIQFGDIVQGCRFHGAKSMTVGRDAWLVGHCLVSPVSIGERSMALMGSVVTKDMLADHVYAGSPAKDVTDRMGPQFEQVSRAQKEARLLQLIDRFEKRHPEHKGKLPEFDVERRTYLQTYSEAEVAFLKEFTPLVKFAPAQKVQDP